MQQQFPRGPGVKEDAVRAGLDQKTQAVRALERLAAGRILHKDRQFHRKPPRFLSMIPYRMGKRKKDVEIIPRVR
jgi:hypothetical protein